MRISGELYQIWDFQSGQGKNKPWSKQSFVVKTLGEYVKHIALISWNSDIEIIQSLKIGDRIEFDIELSSREYNNRWYTDITATNIEILEKQEDYVPPLRQKALDQMAYKEEPIQETLDFTDDTDLPF